MSEKLEQYSKHSYHYLALNAVAQYTQTIAGTWDTCSHSQKVEMLEAMARLTVAVTEVLVENLEQQRQTNVESN